MEALRGWINPVSSWRTKWRESRIQKPEVIKWISGILIIVLLNVSAGCRSYFEVKTASPPSAEMIAGVKDAGKTIIIHFNGRKRVLSDIQIKENMITGTLNEYQMPSTIKPVQPNHSNRYYAGGSGNQRYLLNEVHLFVADIPDPVSNQVTIPMKSFVRMEIYDKDTGATIRSWVFGSLGIVAGVYLLLGTLIVIFVLGGGMV